METDERILLRDKLFEELLNNKIIGYRKNTESYVFYSMDKLKELLNSNDDLRYEYWWYAHEFRTEDEALYCLIRKDDYANHICSYCNTKIKIFYHPKGYRNTCGDKECNRKSHDTEESKQKREITCTVKYGTKNVAQNASVKEKKIRTTREHYNVDNPFQAKEVKEQIRQTNLKNLGVEYPTQSEEVKAKVVDTNMERYGHKCSLQNEEVHEKAVTTNLERYNAPYAIQSPEVVSKLEQSYIEKFGVKNPAQQHITNYDIYSNDDKFKNYIIEQYNQKGMFLSLSDIYPYFNVSQGCLKNKLEQLNLLEYFYIQNSQLELNFENFLNSSNIQYQTHNRNILTTNNNYYEIDFIVNNIGIEINDISTHNSVTKDRRFSKDLSYHQQKSLLAVEKGIRLIHLWEWELRTENIWSKLSKWLLNELNSNKYFINLQNCQLIQVNKELEQHFYNLYSIKDYKDSDICLGLMYNNQLYQIMSFKNIDNQWYFINYGTVYNYFIHNGYQIILDYVIRKYNIQLLKSYCNLDKEDSKLYDQLNFKSINVLNPIVTYCNSNMNISFIEQKGYVPIYNSGIIEYEKIKHNN